MLVGAAEQSRAEAVAVCAMPSSQTSISLSPQNLFNQTCQPGGSLKRLTFNCFQLLLLAPDEPTVGGGGYTEEGDTGERWQRAEDEGRVFFLFFFSLFGPCLMTGWPHLRLHLTVSEDS